VFHGQQKIGQGLRLDALAGIDEQQGPLAGGQGPGHFVGEVHMTGRIDEIEGIGDTIGSRIRQAYGLAFDGDPALALDIHVIENLILKIPVGDHLGGLDHAVRQGRLSVIDMGDNTEIANIFHLVSLVRDCRSHLRTER
jgi:hypothetical protein